MKQITPHAPEPWNYEREYVSAERKQTTGDFIIRDQEARYLCKIAGEANAAFLVRACNSFYGMLDALEMQQMAEYDREASIRKGYFDSAKELRECAIANAKGRAP